MYEGAVTKQPDHTDGSGCPAPKPGSFGIRLILPVLVGTLIACTGAVAEQRESGNKRAEAPVVEDEIKVIGERVRLTREERMRIYAELGKARQHYARSEFDEAFPLLLKTARRGFKNAQARVGHIYLQGLGEVDQDPVQALGWLGAASSGTTSAPIRNYFNDIWKRVPDKYVAGFEEVVEEYRSKYGEDATDVVCELHRPLRSFVKQLVCYFEGDLPQMVRETMDEHMGTDERARLRDLVEQRDRESAESRVRVQFPF